MHVNLAGAFHQVDGILKQRTIKFFNLNQQPKRLKLLLENNNDPKTIKPVLTKQVDD